MHQPDCSCGVFFENSYVAIVMLPCLSYPSVSQHRQHRLTRDIRLYNLMQFSMYDSMFFPSFRLRVNIESRIVWKQYLLLKPNHRINDRPKNLWCQSASTLGWTVYYDLVSTVNLPRKEVIQPHLPVRLPCYDFTPVTNPALGRCFLTVSSRTSGVVDFHGVTGGVYKTRERIQRSVLICVY